MRFFILPFIFLSIISCQVNKPIKIHGRTMGTTYNLVIIPAQDTSTDSGYLQFKIDSLLVEINQLMSTYIKDSEISRFNNQQSTEPFSVSAPFTKVLRTAIQIFHESGGAFDVTVGPLVNLWGFGPKGRIDTPPAPAEINSLLANIGSQHLSIVNDTLVKKDNPAITLDFSAIAKGYAVDAVADLIKFQGYQNFLVEIGGELVVRGNKFGKLWKVGVDKPLPGNQPGNNLQHILRLNDKALATSGDYRNYFNSRDSSFSHEIDPKTGHSIVTGVASATVIALNCMLADAMATAIMVMGAEQGLKWVESKPNVEALIIMHDRENFKELHSSGLDNFIE